MSQTSGEVPTIAVNIRPLLVGSSVPKLMLLTEKNTLFDLNTALAEKPTILIFYRGSW